MKGTRGPFVLNAGDGMKAYRAQLGRHGEVGRGVMVMLRAIFSPVRY